MTTGKTLKEQLASIRNRIFANSAMVQPVSQVAFECESGDTQAAFLTARKEALKWVARRAGCQLPDKAWDGQTFDLADVGSQPTAAVAIEEPRYWAVRIRDADKEVAQRTWTTEIGIGIAPNSNTLFGCRLFCAALGDNPPFPPTIPGVVKQIVRCVNAKLDGRRIIETAWAIDHVNAGELVALLLNPTRKRPVYVLSIPEHDATPLISADTLACDIVGAAHIAVLSPAATYELTDALGREFSVFNGAVRTYQTSFDPESDEPSRHPLALAQSIRDWPEGGKQGFADFLVRQALRESVAHRQAMEDDLPPFITAQAISRKQTQEKAKKENKSNTELLELAVDVNKALQKELQEQEEMYDGLLEIADREQRQVIGERDEARANAAKLRSRVICLEQILKAKGVKSEIETPETFENLQAWESQHLSGAVVILNRAYRAAKKSRLENTKLPYQALLLLRDHYVPMRREGGHAKQKAYKAALGELGLEESPSFSGARASEQGDEYFVQYNGRKRLLDRHLKRSNARDERYAFRLYFFWDEETRQVIVGWFPSHLTTRIS